MSGGTSPGDMEGNDLRAGKPFFQNGDKVAPARFYKYEILNPRFQGQGVKVTFRFGVGINSGMESVCF
jgi:hypothetical protein